MHMLDIDNYVSKFVIWKG